MVTVRADAAPTCGRARDQSSSRLDIYALRSPARIERMAMRQLGMVTPAAADALVVERVLPSPAPKFRARAQVDRCRTIVLRSGVPR